MSDTLRDALILEINHLYDAERQLLKALPKMAKRASSEDLKDALTSHREETEIHIGRLEQVFRLLDKKARGLRCAGMAGIIEEAYALAELDFDGAVRDAYIIGSSQRAEHYEITAYGTSIAWAEAMNLTDVADLLRDTLEEEKAADEQLSAIADDVNVEAGAADEDEDDEDDEEEAAPVRGARRQVHPERAAKASRRATIKR